MHSQGGDMFVPVEAFSDQDHNFETVYPLAFRDAYKAVNAAVFYVIGRLNSGRRVEREEVEGGSLYYVGIDGVVMQIFVLYVADYYATIRAHLVGIYPPPGTQSVMEFLHRREVYLTLSKFLHTLDAEVGKLLRMGLSENDMKPPPPPTHNMDVVFTWQRMYYPNMTDRELADHIGVAYSTVRNARSKHQQLKRIPRGKPRGEEERGGKHKQSRPK
jgi:hypothetical protein